MSEVSQAFTPPTCRGQKPFFGIDFENLTENIFATEHDISNWKEARQSTGTPLYAPSPNLVYFGPQTAENGWRVFLQAHIYDTFQFNHIHQMAPMVDAGAKILVIVGEAARRLIYHCPSFIG